MRLPHFSFVVGIREFSLDPQSVDFLLSGSALFIRGSAPFQQSKYPCTLLTLLPCVIARDQGGGGGRHPRGGLRRRGGPGRGRVRGEGRLDAKVWTSLSSPGTPLLLG